MHLKYVHYFGNESNQNILEAYGLKPKFEEIDKMKPKQCPNCTELAKIDDKFCPKCRMVLSYDAYTETIQDNSSKFKDEISQLKYDHEKQMNGISQQIDKMESLISRVFSDHLTGVESIDRKLMQKYMVNPDADSCIK